MCTNPNKPTETIRGLQTKGQFTGGTVDWYAPWNFGATGSDSTDYFDAYLSVGGNAEAGIFYYANKGWVAFANAAAWVGDGGWDETPISIQPGQKYQLKIVVTNNNTVTFYINGAQVCQAKTGHPLNYGTSMQLAFKFGKVDENKNVHFDKMVYKNFTARNSTGSVYSPLSLSDMNTYDKAPCDGVSYITVDERFPSLRVMYS